jgi:hypothetical protein
LACATEQGAVLLYDANKDTMPPVRLGMHSTICTAIAYSPINEHFMASAGLDYLIQFHDPREKSTVRVMKGANPIHSLCFHPTGHVIVAGDQAGKITAYDIRQDDTPLFQVEHTAGTPVQGIAYPRKLVAGAVAPGGARNINASRAPSTESSFSSTASQEFIPSSPTMARSASPLSVVSEDSSVGSHASASSSPVKAPYVGDAAIFSPVRDGLDDTTTRLFSPLGAEAGGGGGGALSPIKPQPWTQSGAASSPISAAPAVDVYSNTLEGRPSLVLSPPRATTPLFHAASSNVDKSAASRRTTTDSGPRSLDFSGVSMDDSSFMSPVKRNSSEYGASTVFTPPPTTGRSASGGSKSVVVAFTPTPRQENKTRSATNVSTSNPGPSSPSARRPSMASPIPKTRLASARTLDLNRSGGVGNADDSFGLDDSVRFRLCLDDMRAHDD